MQGVKFGNALDLRLSRHRKISPVVSQLVLLANPFSFIT